MDICGVCHVTFRRKQRVLWLDLHIMPFQSELCGSPEKVKGGLASDNASTCLINLFDKPV